MSALNLPTTSVELVRRTAFGVFIALLVTLVATPFALAGQTANPAVIAQSSPAPSATSAAADSADLYDGNWHTTVAPYAWLPNINGTLNYKLPRNPTGATTLGIHAGPNSYLSHLNSGFLGYAAVQKGDWTALADIIYMNLSSSAGSVVSVGGPKGRFSLPITTNFATAMNSTIIEAYGGRTLYHGSAGALNLVAGIRSMNLNSSTSWTLAGPNKLLSRSGSVSASATITDGVLAAQGSLNLGSSRWFVPYYLDYGWGSANTTAQQWLGVGYAARHGQRTLLVYRNLAYFTDGSQLLQVIRLGGPEIGYAFRI